MTGSRKQTEEEKDKPEASIVRVGDGLVQALTQVCRSLKHKDVEWRKKGNPKRVWWIDSVEEFM